MSEPNETEKDGGKIHWVLLIFFGLLILFLYIFFREKQIEDLKAKLKEHEEALESLKKDLAESQKLLEKVHKAKDNYKLGLRISLIVVIGLMNWLYLANYYPPDFTLRDVCESAATFTGTLAVITTGTLFLRYGNTFDLKAAYESFQIWILTKRFKKKAEVIETLIQLHTVNQQTLLQEIEKTKKALAELEPIIKSDQEPPTPAVSGLPIVPPPEVVLKVQPTTEVKKDEDLRSGLDLYRTGISKI